LADANVVSTIGDTVMVWLLYQ